MDEFQDHFQDAEEKFNLKRKIHDKNGGINQANLLLEEDYWVPCEGQKFDINKMYSYIDNLASALTQEKDVLEKLVNNNTDVITQLAELTNKFEKLSS